MKLSIALLALATASIGAVPAAEAETASSELEVITVTAQKRSESAQNIPVSVSVLGANSLAQNGIKDLVQAATLIPGVVFSRAPDDGLALTFRGLGTVARSQAFELSQAMFVDGIFMGKGRLYTTSLFDLERLEFIKGTESTLLGKNASLGAVSVVPRQPGTVASFDGRAAYEFEHGGGYLLDAAGDLPLEDHAALRLAAHYNDLHGWVHNDDTNHWGPEQKDAGLRATIRLIPSDAFAMTGSYQYAGNKRIGASYQLVGEIPPIYGNGLLDDHASQFTASTRNHDTFHDTTSHIAGLKGEWNLGAYSLISQTALVRYKLSFIDDFDFSPDDAINFLRNETYRQFSQELRIQSRAGARVEYMAGLYYLDSHWDSLERQAWSVPSFPPPPAPISGQLFNGPFANHYLQHSNSYSAFASASWHLTDALRLAGGVRITRETKDVVFGRINDAPFTIWNTIANPPFDPTPLALRSNFLDGNFSVQYNVGSNVMIYAAFGHGSKAGGFAETNTIAVAPSNLVGGKVPAALVAAGSEVKDEFAKSYEIGIKTTWLERRLLFNLAGFWTDVRNFQDTVFTGGPLGFITFTGPARSRGFEVQSAFKVTPGLRFDAGLTFTDASGVIQPIDPETLAPEVDAHGNPIYSNFTRSQAPRVVLNLTSEFEHPLIGTLDVWIGAGLRYRSSMYNQRQEMFPSSALATVDARVGVGPATHRWKVSLMAQNAFNRITEDFASPSVDPRFGAFYGAYLAGPTPTRSITFSFDESY